MNVAELRGRHAVKAAEDARKVVGVGEAAGIAHLADVVGGGFQHDRAHFEAVFHQIPLDRDAVLELEHLEEMRAADPDVLRDALDGYII